MGQGEQESYPVTDGLCEAAGELFSLSSPLFRWYSDGAHLEMPEDVGRNSIKVHWTQCVLEEQRRLTNKTLRESLSTTLQGDSIFRESVSIL